MRSTTVRPAVTAGVCLVAFGFGAATIADPTDAASTAGLGVSAQLSLPVSSTLVFGVLTVLVVGLAAGVYLLGDAQASDMTMGKAIPFLAGILLLGTVAAGLFLPPAATAARHRKGSTGSVMSRRISASQRVTRVRNPRRAAAEARSLRSD
ncbi:hypothetical protein ACFQH2_07555 [Natronoarchaeum sp. GCM10025703]|uniref:hypothetical protein n=1 Tax=Natronoarchaeum sp. GCM10025703 TaxID=3252685 RepID=UPI00361B7A6B